MRQSKLLYKTLKETPKEAKTISHNLLVRGSFIDQLSAGIWTLMPLGFRVFRKTEEIIRKEINSISGQELLMPSLQPKEIWQRTDRWNSMEPPLYKLKDQHKKEFTLGPTHEEVITDIVKRYISSYKQLPLYLYQIQNKYRNEIRVSGGLLRVKEFVMKDLYSFHTTKDDLNRYYKKVIKAYQNIFKAIDLETEIVKADSGSIGGSESHEFMVKSPSGEDKISKCKDCGQVLKITNLKSCKRCQGRLEYLNGIEAAHTFKLCTLYSEKMGAYFVDQHGKKHPIQMGCYGIGLGRLMATVVEVFHDSSGIIWPKAIAPYDIHLLNLDFENNEMTDKIYYQLVKLGYSILYDDRGVSPPVKLKDADLIGIPLRLIVSPKTKSRIEYKKRSEKKTKLLTTKQLFKYL